jgi:hypothetical protein
MSRECRRGLIWAGGPGPRRRPRAETFSAAGYGARAASQAEEVCDRNARADHDKRGFRAEEDQASAERSAARAATRDGKIPWQYGRQHGSEGRCGSAAAAMRPKGGQKNGDERGHTHVHWAALDTQTKLFRRDTRTSSSVRFAGEGADGASRATCREKALIKVQQRGRLLARGPT